jgi:hypothetical protein
MVEQCSQSSVNIILYKARVHRCPDSLDNPQPTKWVVGYKNLIGTHYVSAYVFLYKFSFKHVNINGNLIIISH